MVPPPLVLDAPLQFRRSPGAVILPLLAFLGIVLIIPPAVWHARNRNIAACSLIFWITLSNLFCFINALIWPTDDISRWWNGVGLCDIQVKLTWAFSVGAACSLACIMRNLARVLDVDRSGARSGSASRKRQTIIDLLWCFACPIWVMAVDYIVQSNRYYIFTIAGCTPAIDESWLGIVLILMWAPIFCVVASFYCILVMIRLHRHRRQFMQILSNHSSLTKSRFWRLFLMALTLLLVLLPVQFYILATNLSYADHPYSWSNVHRPDWSQIIMVPTGGQVAFDRWIRVASAFLVFIFFGMGTEAMAMYRKWLAWLGLGRCLSRLTSSKHLQGPKEKLFSLGTQMSTIFSSRKQSTTATAGSSDPHPMSITATVSTTSSSDPEKGFESMATMLQKQEQPSAPETRSSRLWRPFNRGR
ncbi:MAG: hypothetical protein M1823_005686 [Watsoniomyces obsoletus]|nr:MAG: hypothetical protein M1823_005686 [Watsoniomyces obsoletus]